MKKGFGYTVDEISAKLTDEILTGIAPPGAHLNEKSLAERFEVSRTPVREALRQVVATGLAERRPHLGVFVNTIPANRLMEMFELGAELEGVCARHCANKMTTQEKSDLLAFHDKTKIITVQNDIESYRTANFEFHGIIFKGCHNQYLQEAAEKARSQALPFRRAQFRADKRLDKSHQEHGKIVKAIIEGKGARAEKLMRTHLIASYNATKIVLDSIFGNY